MHVEPDSCLHNNVGDRAQGGQRGGGPLNDSPRERHELEETLAALLRRQEELVRRNAELEDANRALAALYAGLDDRVNIARQADEMRMRFLANVTHRFRSPINAILGLTELLRTERIQQGSASEPELDHITQAATQLWTLVSDLLDRASADAGRTPVCPASIEVEQLLASLRGRVQPHLATGSVALAFDDASGIPPVVTDAALVSRILRHLISNGLKYTERGDVRVSARWDPVHETVTFQVADTGIGIAPEDHDLIFEEFEQIAHPLQGRVRGTGLGLPLSRHLAGRLGGSLTVESDLGAGSIFSLKLPVVWRPPPGVGSPDLPEASGDAAASADDTDAPRMTVLIVDDDPVTRFLLRRCLPPAGFDVTEAADGEEGLACVAASPPDLVILDLLMPGMKGGAVLAALRANPATRAIPVVVATAGDLDDAAIQAVRADAAAVLSKSDLTPDTLPSILRNAARGWRTSEKL